MTSDRCNYYYLFILDYLLPFYSPPPLPPPLTAQKIKIKKNENKTPRDTIILHKCTKNHDHTLCFPEI